MGSSHAPTSNFFGPQHRRRLYFDGIVPIVQCKQVLLYFFGPWPTPSGRVITTKADALGANAQTFRQPDTGLSKHIFIQERCGWEENPDQKDTPKVTTLCSNFNTYYNPAAVPCWL